ncbi:H+/Cl- antiporter ClcA [Variovorax sp. Sphag1AA]|nr:H+/Cl- antiporter ClcA [Variovorax sp. Sphag1AA]
MYSKHPEQLALFPHATKWLLLSTAVGALAGAASAVFLLALEAATSTRESHQWLIWCMPIAGFVVSWLYLKVGQRVEAGNNLLIDEIHDPQKVIPLRMVPLILGSTVLSHLVGASVGREGTAVQMGGALADQVTHAFKLKHEDRRILLMAGISAGFASIFGTPLAGALFGLEVLAIGKLRYDALLACVVAAIVGAQTTHFLGVHHTHYVAGTIPPLSVWGVTAVLLAGGVFGIVGMLFADATHWLSGFAKRYISYAPLRPLIGGALIATAMWTVGGPRYAGLGIPVIVESFSQPVAPWDFAAKMAYTVASIGTGFKGGEVTPLFYIGATLGNAMAPLLHMPVPLLAALGFVAVFAGAANTPLACTLMAIELFGAEIGVYAVVACVLAYLFSGHTGIYRAQRVGHAKHRHVPEGLKLSDVPAYRRKSRAATASKTSLPVEEIEKS